MIMMIFIFIFAYDSDQNLQISTLDDQHLLFIRCHLSFLFQGVPSESGRVCI